MKPWFYCIYLMRSIHLVGPLKVTRGPDRTPQRGRTGLHRSEVRGPSPTQTEPGRLPAPNTSERPSHLLLTCQHEGGLRRALCPALPPAHTGPPAGNQYVRPTWKTAAAARPSVPGPTPILPSPPGDASRSSAAIVALPLARGSASLAVDTKTER